MTENDKLQMFEDRPIRTAWDETQEEWYFSIVDVVTVLTESGDYNTGRKYWNKLKQRLKAEGSELVTNCHQLKMKAADGKRRLTDVANTGNSCASFSRCRPKGRTVQDVAGDGRPGTH